MICIFIASMFIDEFQNWTVLLGNKKLAQIALDQT